jgi:hypothetical protein
VFDDQGAGELQDQFYIDLKILEREELLGFFLDVCKNYVVLAFCQSEPDEREVILKEEWMTRLNSMWINSQKDNEYFPIHYHTNPIHHQTNCALSAVIYLKIPEYLPSRKFYNNIENDGAITFISNASRDPIWAKPNLQINPQVGDFFIMPATQRHQVYPFRTADGKGERRSVSFNANFTSKSEQEALRKQREDQEAI